MSEIYQKNTIVTKKKKKNTTDQFFQIYFYSYTSKFQVQSIENELLKDETIFYIM